MGFQRHDLRLLGNLLQLNLRDKFLGSWLGRLWAVVNPLLMLGIFTFVFGYVYKAKLPGAETSLAYVIWLISGYGPWLSISEGLVSSTASVISNIGLVKNLAFKTELLPVAGALMGAVPLCVSLMYLGLLLAVSGVTPSWSWFALLLVAILQFILIAGIGLMLAALNVFVRDVALVLPNLLIIVLFATPIFYPLEAFPAILRPVFLANPIYLIAEGYRQPLLHDAWPSIWSLVYLAALSFVLFMAGLWMFRRVKDYFDSRL